MEEDEYANPDEGLYDDLSMMQEAKQELVEVLVSEEHLDYTTELRKGEPREFAVVSWFARRWHMPWMEEIASDIKRNRVPLFRKGRKGIEDIIKVQPPQIEQRRGLVRRLLGSRR